MFNKSKEDLVKDSYRRGYEACERIYVKRIVTEKQKLKDDFEIEIVNLKLEKASLESDVIYYKKYYEEMKTQYNNVWAHGLVNKAITSKLAEYSKDQQVFNMSKFQEISMLEKNATDNLLKDEKK